MMAMPAPAARDFNSSCSAAATAYEEFFDDPQRWHPRRVPFIAVDESLSHWIEVERPVPDALRYEPCGLNQMYSMRYGTVIVRAPAGLPIRCGPRYRHRPNHIFNDYNAGAVAWPSITPRPVPAEGQLALAGAERHGADLLASPGTALRQQYERLARSSGRLPLS
jgi:hypothetical protein